MLKAFAKKLIQAVITIWVIMTLSFLVLDLAPGGPLSTERRLPAQILTAQYVRLGIGVPIIAERPCIIKELVAKPGDPVPKIGVARCMDKAGIGVKLKGTLLALAIGRGDRVKPGMLIGALARPAWSRYLHMLVHMAVFDFGPSYESGGLRTVRDIIFDSAPVTAGIGLAALFIALFMGLLTGYFVYTSPLISRFFNVTSTFVLAVPVVVAAPASLYLCAVRFNCLPIGWDGTLEGAILPVITLGTVYWAVFHRVITRASMDFMKSPHFTALVARGLRWRYLTLHHLRHVSLGVVGLLGPIAAALLTGSVVVEEVFHVPGLAGLFVSSALSRDYPVLMGTVYFYALLLVTLNMGTDMLVFILDPRTRRQRT